MLVTLAPARACKKVYRNNLVSELRKKWFISHLNVTINISLFWCLTQQLKSTSKIFNVIQANSWHRWKAIDHQRIYVYRQMKAISYSRPIRNFSIISRRVFVLYYYVAVWTVFPGVCSCCMTVFLSRLSVLTGCAASLLHHNGYRRCVHLDLSSSLVF